MEPDWYVEPDCDRCNGSGTMYVQNGPDDVDKDLCYCVKERSEMGKTLANYPSKSSPGKSYSIIEAADGTPYCDCWTWKRKKTCSHLNDYLQNSGQALTGQQVSNVVNAPTPKVDQPEEMKRVEEHIDNVINKNSSVETMKV